MAYETYNVNGLKVYTGDLSTSLEHLNKMMSVTSTIMDIYFCKRTVEGIEEKVLYDLESLMSKKTELGITIRCQSSREIETLHVVGFDRVNETLKDLDIGPESIALGVGRTVNAYKEGTTLYGIWIPTFTKERSVF